MKAIDELLNIEESAWSKIVNWLEEEEASFEIFKSVKEQAEKTLVELQVTTKSTLGAVAYMTSGMVFDYGWLKVLGSAGSHISGDLLSYNGIGIDNSKGAVEGALVVAYDVLGGKFAINGDAFEGETGSIFYFAPDTLKWEDLEVTYTDFIRWLSLGKLSEFYGILRWEDWEKDIKQLNYNQGFSFHPPLWSKEGNVKSSQRQVVSITELLNF